MTAEQIVVAVVLAALSYVVGSIPFGIVVARLTNAPDPRTLGSGRTGGTNALRAMGRKRALLVVTGDVLKGVIPVLVARYVTGNAAVEVLCAIAAILGSTRSMFVGFKGGRGVATSVGTMLVIFPPAILVGAPVFVGVILITRYVSLGSLLAITAGAVLVGIWWLAANGSCRSPTPSTRRSARSWSGSRTRTTWTACSTAPSAASTSGCSPATDAHTWALKCENRAALRDPVRARLRISRRASCGSSPSNRRVCHWSAGTGRGLPCRSSSTSP